MRRTILTALGVLLVFATCRWAAGQEGRSFANTQVQNNTGQAMDVMIVGRPEGVIDRNYGVRPGAPRPSSQNYLYGGWRAVCWWDSRSGEYMGSKMVQVDRHNQVISVELSQKIFLLPAYSCSGEDVSDESTIQCRQNNREMITSSFLGNVPAENLVVYGDPHWPDSTNATNSRLGYRTFDIQRAIETCPANSEDTIVVYWNGHGGGSRHQFGMVQDGMAGSEILAREQLLDWIQSRNARLSVLLTDTCAKSVVSREYVEYAPPRQPATISPLFFELFLVPRGVVNLNSARPGEYAFRVNPIGSVFTQVLASPGGNGLPEGRGYFWAHANVRKSWSTLITEMQKNQTIFFRRKYPHGWNGQMDQHIWEIQLPDESAMLSRRCENTFVQNRTGFPLDVVIVGRGDRVLDRNVNIGPGVSRRTEDGYLYSGSRIVAWWRNDDPTKTGIGTKEVMIRHSGQIVQIP